MGECSGPKVSRNTAFGRMFEIAEGTNHVDGTVCNNFISDVPGGVYGVDQERDIHS